MLMLAQRFGSIDLTTGYLGKDLSYFTWPVIGIVAYPKWVDPLVGGIAILGLAVVIALGWLRGHLIKPLPTLVGGIAYIILLFGLVLPSRALWSEVLKGHPETSGLALPDFNGSGFVILGFIIVTMIIFIILMAILSRYTGVASMTAGALIAWIALGFYLLGPSAFNIGNLLEINFAVWSLVGGVTGLAVAIFIRKPGWKLALLALSALPAVFMFIPLIVLSMLKPSDGAMAPVLLLILLLGLVLPQILFVVGQKDAPISVQP